MSRNCIDRGRCNPSAQPVRSKRFSFRGGQGSRQAWPPGANRAAGVRQRKASPPPLRPHAIRAPHSDELVAVPPGYEAKVRVPEGATRSSPRPDIEGIPLNYAKAQKEPIPTRICRGHAPRRMNQ